MVPILRGFQGYLTRCLSLGRLFVTAPRADGVVQQDASQPGEQLLEMFAIELREIAMRVECRFLHQIRRGEFGPQRRGDRPRGQTAQIFLALFEQSPARLEATSLGRANPTLDSLAIGASAESNDCMVLPL